MTYRIYGDDGEHTTLLEEYETLEEAKAGFKETVVSTREYNLKANEEEENHEWFTFYIELHEVVADGEEDWEPILQHEFAEDENPLPKLVKQWEELNSW